MRVCADSRYFAAYMLACLRSRERAPYQMQCLCASCARCGCFDQNALLLSAK